MLADVAAGLELRQDDAVERALLADEGLRSAISITPVCGACGRDIDRTRLLICRTASRCSLCLLAMRR